MTQLAIVAASFAVALVAVVGALAASYHRGYQSGFNASSLSFHKRDLDESIKTSEALEDGLNEASAIGPANLDIVGGLLPENSNSDTDEKDSEAQAT